MSLYSNPDDIRSHQVRMVLAEKSISVNIIRVTEFEPCNELLELNPYNTVPTLVDRELVLHKIQIITEYLDERFPHPPLLPVYPVSRAKARLMIDRIEEDWYSQVDTILMDKTENETKAAREQLRTLLVSVVPIFNNNPYFLSEEFTLVDCVVAPLLWRLPILGVKLPNSAKAIKAYEDRIFSRPAFKSSLTEEEKEMREVDDF